MSDERKKELTSEEKRKNSQSLIDILSNPAAVGSERNALTTKAQQLIDLGIDVNYKSPAYSDYDSYIESQSPLTAAIEFESFSLTAQILAQKPAFFATELVKATQTNNSFFVSKICTNLIRADEKLTVSTALDALNQAVRQRNLSMVREILQVIVKMPNPEKIINHIENYLDQTPLTLAAEKSHIGIIKLLLAVGADPQIENYEGRTALTLGNSDVTKCIQDFLDALDPKKNFAGIKAAKQLISDMKAQRKTTNYKQNQYKRKLLMPDSFDDVISFKSDPLFFEKPSADEPVFKKHKSAIALAQLMASVKDMDSKAAGEILQEHNNDPSFSTPALHLAIKMNDIEMVKFLINRDADVNGLNSNGQTPLINAINANSVEIVQTLLQSPSINPNLISNILHTSVSRFDLKKGTALMLASFANKKQIAALLLEKNADSTINREGNTAFSLATKTSDVEIMDLLFNHGIKDDFFVLAATSAISRAALECLQRLNEKQKIHDILSVLDLVKQKLNTDSRKASDVSDDDSFFLSIQKELLTKHDMDISLPKGKKEVKTVAPSSLVISTQKIKLQQSSSATPAKLPASHARLLSQKSFFPSDEIEMSLLGEASDDVGKKIPLT